MSNNHTCADNLKAKRKKNIYEIEREMTVDHIIIYERNEHLKRFEDIISLNFQDRSIGHYMHVSREVANELWKAVKSGKLVAKGKLVERRNAFVDYCTANNLPVIRVDYEFFD